MNGAPVTPWLVDKSVGWLTSWQNGGGAMAKTRYAPDRGLTARMTLTMFLLGLVFVAFITILVLVLSATGTGVQRRHRVLRGAARPGPGCRLPVLLRQDRAQHAGAQLVTPQDGPQAARLHGIMDRLCALANMPKPRVAIAPSPMLNAFATGRNSKIAVLVRDHRPAAQQPGRRELEGVLAHELSHVAHKDVVVMTIASFIGIIAAPAGPVRVLLRAVRRRRPGPRREQQQRRRAAGHVDRAAGRHGRRTRSASCSSGCCPGTGSWPRTGPGRCSPGSPPRWPARCRR